MTPRWAENEKSMNDSLYTRGGGDSSAFIGFCRS